MSDFHEILFPPAISYGSSGGPRFKTTLFTTDAGYEQRNIDWSEVRHEYDVAHAMREFDGTLNLPGIRELHAFFLARAGRSHGFRFKDWNDYRVPDEQIIGFGDGSNRVFQIVKTYYEKQFENGFESIFDRRITKVDWDSVITVFSDGEPILDWSLDYDTGILTIADTVDAPNLGDAVTVSGVEFHVPVRFDTDQCDVTVEFWNGGSWPSIPLIELRQANDVYRTTSLTLDDTIHEVLFPVGVSFGASGGPKFKTAIYTVDSGYEANVRDWIRMRAEYECSQEVKSPQAMETITRFFMNRRGMAYGFRYKDWSDYRLKQEKISGGDHAQTVFPITKTYTSNRLGADPITYVRRITKIAWNTIAGVTVGGQVAFQSFTGDWSDVTNFNNPWYRVDVDKGLIEFLEPPAGRRYEGETQHTPLTLISGGIFNNSAATNFGRHAYVDPDGGYLYLKGSGSGGQEGIRRVRLSDGVEDLQVASTTIGFPDTDGADPYDNRTLESFVAVGGGFIYVTVGGFNIQVFYKIALSDFTIAASNGVADSGLPGPGQISLAISPGSISKDGSRVIHLGVLGGDNAVTVFNTADLTVARQPSVGTLPIANNPLIGACPLYEYNFGILLSWDALSTKGRLVELWDDASHKLLEFDGTGDWIARDEGPDSGVLIGWHDDAGNYVSKYSEQEQKEVWRTNVPRQGRLHPQSRISGHLAYAADDIVIHIDTANGDVIARAIEIENFSSAQFYDRITDRIFGVPEVNEVSGFLDTATTGLAILDAADIVIGAGEFHVPVRFDTDQLDVSQDNFNVSSWPSINLVEIRDWADLGVAAPIAPRGVKSPHYVEPGKQWRTIVKPAGQSAVYPTAYQACYRQWQEYANTERTTFIGATVLPSGNAECMWSYIPADPLPTIVSLENIVEP